jgi:hypothetical protein
MKRRPQSDITSALVRQLICLLSSEQNMSVKLDATVREPEMVHNAQSTLIIKKKMNTYVA